MGHRVNSHAEKKNGVSKCHCIEFSLIWIENYRGKHSINAILNRFDVEENAGAFRLVYVLTTHLVWRFRCPPTIYFPPWYLDESDLKNGDNVGPEELPRRWLQFLLPSRAFYELLKCRTQSPGSIPSRAEHKKRSSWICSNPPLQLSASRIRIQILQKLKGNLIYLWDLGKRTMKKQSLYNWKKNVVGGKNHTMILAW